MESIVQDNSQVTGGAVMVSYSTTVPNLRPIRPDPFNHLVSCSGRNVTEAIYAPLRNFKREKTVKDGSKLNFDHFDGMLVSRKALSRSRSSSQSHGSQTRFEENVGLVSRNNVELIDLRYLSDILSRRDWVLLLNDEFTARKTSLDMCLVVRTLQNQENALNSVKFYVWVSDYDGKMVKNRSVQKAMADNLFRKGPVVLSTDLIKEIRNSGCRITEDILCLLISSWGRLGLAKYCTDVFSQISFLGLSPSTRLYNSVIDALVKSNSLDLAYLKFQQMRTDDCIPDRFTYNILIHGVCRIGIVDEAIRLLKQMEGSGHLPNVFTYTILIDGFCNAKRVDEVFLLLETMRKKNVIPSEATYRSLVHGAFRALAPDKAYELVIRVIGMNESLPKHACDTVLYCLSKNSMPRQAADFLRMMWGKGIFPENSTFDILMACFVKGLDLNETCSLVNIFIERGGSLGFNSFIILIKALFKIGRIEEGDWYLHKMLQSGLVSSVFSFNMLIDCLCQAEMVERAYETLTLMHQRGVTPNLITFNTLINSYSKICQVRKVRELLKMILEKGLRPDIFTFTSIIDVLCRVHQFEDAFNCFEEMVEWDVAPNSFIYNILIRSFCNADDFGKSTKILRKMKADGLKLDISPSDTL
ncbi:hypothetical protein Sjap_016364 [Stephania japonica]|uniref:Pentatricopeptide repeat-containing protein n=1 Tax=Stephania japonica TaxID=461633 RepID=A0AAP0IL67_9MAGN